MKTDTTNSTPNPTLETSSVEAWRQDLQSRREVPFHRLWRPFLGIAALLSRGFHDTQRTTYQDGTPIRYFTTGRRHFVPVRDVRFGTVLDVPPGHFRDRVMNTREAALLRIYRAAVRNHVPVVEGQPEHQWDLRFRPSEHGGRDTLRPIADHQALALGLNLSHAMTEASFRTCWREYRRDHQANGKGPGWYREYRDALESLPEPMLVFSEHRMEQLVRELFTTTVTEHGRQVEWPRELYKMPHLIQERFCAAVAAGLPLVAQHPGNVHFYVLSSLGRDPGGPAVTRAVLTDKQTTELWAPRGCDWQVKHGERVQTGQVLVNLARPYAGWSQLSLDHKVSRIHKVLGSERRVSELFVSWFLNQAIPFENGRVMLPLALAGGASPLAEDSWFEVDEELVRNEQQQFAPVPLVQWHKGRLLDGYQVWRHGHPGLIMFNLDPATDPRFRLPSRERFAAKAKPSEQELEVAADAILAEAGV